MKRKQFVTALMSACMLAGTANVFAEEAVNTEAPKYIFMFIGDGMSYPQIELTNYFVSANNQDGAQVVNVDGTDKTVLNSTGNLTMMSFETAGSAQTYDSSSFAPDSASTATAIATGHKTWSGSINVSEDFTQEYETIAEKLKAQKDYRIGVISSVNLNHATPAAFYAHQSSRNNYYEIGQELVESGFDYFAGGGLKKTTGNDGDRQDLYEMAAEAGYKVVMTADETNALTPDDGKVIVIDEKLADSEAMNYELDRKEGELALADYVSKGIEMLNNDNGFFMMVEGGKIDWACHANDAGAAMADTLALDKAVEVAVNFYNEHPDETLIIVTGDHETGGLTIGFAGTDYDTFLTNLNNQKISYAKFDSDYVSAYKENGTDFDTVMADVTELFGLRAPQEGSEDGLVMTDYEYEKLKATYDKTMNPSEEALSQEDHVLYGTYEPLTVTITHILNNKSGINFGSYSHTGLPVEVLVKGAASDKFAGFFDNTDIYFRLAELTGIE